MNEITITIDGNEAEVISDAEVNDVARKYIESLVDEMLMNECRGEIPVYSIERIDIRAKREALELTEVHIDDVYFDSLLTEKAECVKDIPNGWTPEEFIALLTKSNVIEHM